MKKNLLIVFLVAVIISAGYLWHTGLFDQFRSVPAADQAAQLVSAVDDNRITAVATDGALSDQQTIQLITQVQEHIDLAYTQSPLVAAIIDASQLQADQPFYKNAQNGDVLLIFADLQKAVIYRPQTDRLVNVGPVLINNEAAANAGQ